MRLKKCLCCGSDDLFKSLDLGAQPPANNLTTEPFDSFGFELAVNTCGACKHSQLTVAVDPGLLFEHYLYQTGTSQTLLRYFSDFADHISSYHDFPEKHVLDIGSNDGSLLDIFKSRGWTVQGIDPAKNLMEMNAAKGIPVVNDFFPSKHLNGRKFDLITCFNCFAHISDPLAVLSSIKELLADDGVCAIQTSQRDMVPNAEFDTVYHEHISFFNIFSFERLCSAAGMTLESVSMPEVHGGSYLFVVGKNSEKRIDLSVLPRKEYEKAELPMYLGLQGRFERKRKDCIDLLDQIVNDGYTLIGVGAPAKGMVLLHSLGIKIPFVIDDNPLKQGKFIPGLGSRIIPFSECPPDGKKCFIVLAWTLYDEMKLKIRENFGDEAVVIRLMPEISR